MDENDVDFLEDEFDVEEEDHDEINDNDKADGFADMMSKILNQKTGDKVPVLAKRKTALMKEMEGSHKDADRLKRQRAEKKSEKEKQLVVPDLSSADFERQLRKLATRGVVALFNAIAKTKKDAADKESAENSKDKEVAETTINRTDVKQMTHENFLAMLKGGKKDARVLEEFESTSNKGSIMTNSRDRSSGSEVAERIAGKSSSGAAGAAGGITWNALLDEYPLAGQSMALKNWDKDEDDESADGDNVEDKQEDGISDMKEGGLRMTSSAAMEQISKRKQTGARKKK